MKINYYYNKEKGKSFLFNLFGFDSFEGSGGVEYLFEGFNCFISVSFIKSLRI